MATDGSSSVIQLGTVIARIMIQNCIRREDQDDLTSLCFQTSEGFLFMIPRPLENDGYTLEHLIEIEVQLERCGLELFPLDQNLTYILN